MFLKRPPPPWPIIITVTSHDYHDFSTHLVTCLACSGAAKKTPKLNITGCLWLAINTLRPRQNGRHFPDDILKWIFLNENIWISIKMSLKFVSRGSINNIPALVRIMAWRLPGDKPLSEPMVVRLLMHICVTQPQWVKSLVPGKSEWSFRYVIFKQILAIDCWGIFCEIDLI